MGWTEDRNALTFGSPGVSAACCGVNLAFAGFGGGFFVFFSGLCGVGPDIRFSPGYWLLQDLGIEGRREEAAVQLPELRSLGIIRGLPICCAKS